MSNAKQSGQDFEQEPQDESEKSLSLMGGVVGPEGLPEASDFNAPPEGKRGISHGTLLILAVMIVAACTLYVMRHGQVDMTTSPGAREVEAKIEQALAKLSKPDALSPDDPLVQSNLKTLFRDTNAIVAMFSRDVSQRQVPIDYIKKNPFVMPSYRVAAPSATGSPDRGERNETAQHRKMLAEFKELKLQTIMKGRVPIAVINGQFLQIGQSMGVFKVKSINGLTVQLEAGGETFTLTMEEKPGENSGGGSNSGLRPQRR